MTGTVPSGLLNIPSLRELSLVAEGLPHKGTNIGSFVHLVACSFGLKIHSFHSHVPVNMEFTPRAHCHDHLFRYSTT